MPSDNFYRGWNTNSNSCYNQTQMNNANDELRLLVEKRIIDLKNQNSQFSMRAMARYLDLTPSSLSEFISGKRNFSPERIKNIIEKIPLDPKLKTKLNEQLSRQNKLKTKEEIERLQLEIDLYYLVSDDIYYTLLCLVELDEFKNDLDWMASKTNKSKKEIQVALERLIKLNFIKEIDETLRINTENLNTTDEIANKFLKTRHENNLKSALNSLIFDDVENRFFTFETLAISKDAFPEIKKAITDCQDRIVQISKTYPKHEVYEFCFNFYPKTIQLIQESKNEVIQ